MVLPGMPGISTKNGTCPLAATPIGYRVRVEAMVTAVDGKRASFAVTAYDDQEKIGEGTYVRYVIDFARFMKAVGQKAAEEPAS